MNKKEKEEQFDEIVKARNEKIIESGSYVRVEVVVGDDNMIVPKVEGKKFSVKMMAAAIMALEGTAQELRERNPLADIATNFYGAKSEAYERNVGDDE